MRILLVLLGILSVAAAKAQLDSIWVVDRYRYYHVYLPSQYDGETALPMVIGLHGGFGSALQFPDQSLMSESAEENGFIALYPDGLGYLLAPTLHYWNAGTCCAYPFQQGIDDVGFIDVLIDSVAALYAVDLNRVYATGISNGAMMSYRLACELSHRIAAIAPVEGSLMVHPCNPDNPVPVVHFHSYLDSNIPYQGGVGDGASDHYNPPMDSVMNVFSEIAHCEHIADTIYDGFDYTHVIWDSCDCGYRMDYYICTDGGHSWPGGEGTIIGDDPSELMDANALMWAFFQEFSLDCTPTGTPGIQEVDQSIFPNPSSGELTLSGIGTPGEIRIFSASGSEVFRHSPNGEPVHLDLSHLPNGLYFIHYGTGGKRWIKM
ncbi:MAG: T9SS type A sorting domain-containing protein [Flavobacteriales bacterium]|nr:T9SS type A sorting domain-containing protein [Flavobacteriales bacterium]